MSTQHTQHIKRAIAEAFAEFFTWNACEESVVGIDKAYGNMVKTAVNYWGALVIDVRMDELAEHGHGGAEFKLRFPDDSILWVDALSVYIPSKQERDTWQLRTPSAR